MIQNTQALHNNDAKLPLPAKSALSRPEAGSQISRIYQIIVESSWLVSSVSKEITVEDWQDICLQAQTINTWFKLPWYKWIMRLYVYSGFTPKHQL